MSRSHMTFEMSQLMETQADTLDTLYGALEGEKGRIEPSLKIKRELIGALHDAKILRNRLNVIHRLSTSEA